MITVFLSRFGAFLESSLIFANKYVHFSKQLVQTAPHNGLPAKACNLLKVFSSYLKSKYLCQSTYQCYQNEKSLCRCSQTRQSKCLVMLSIYSFSQSLWYISRIILDICKTVSAFLKTTRTNSKTPWITCKSQSLTQNP